MDASSAASQALIEALKAPDLAHAQRLALLTALQALHAMPVGTASPVDAPAPTAPRRPAAPPPPAAAVDRRADSVRLTRESIAALPLPADGERYVYDTACPQLAVRLRPGGKTFMLVMWDRQRRRAVKSTLGKIDVLTPEQARGKAQAMVAAVADGQDVRRPAADGLTMRKLVEMWHAEKSKANRTADEMRDKALDYLGRLEHRPVAEVKREHIGAVHHHIATEARRRVLKRIDSGTDSELRSVEVGEPGIPATADKWLAIMSSVYGWANGKGLVGDNPCKGIRKAFAAKEAARNQYLHGDALLRFWQVLEADKDADVRDLLLVALYTGQRKGNVLSMRWDDVDLAAGLWAIPASATKQKKQQTNPLSAQAQMILARRHADAGTEWVFPAVRSGADGEVGHMSETRPRDAWERITKAAGIEGLRIHDLRHTAGSWLARLGANEAVRQKALGHQTPQMAARYSHLELDPVAVAMQRMGDAITAAATKPAAKVRRLKATKA